MNSIERQLSRLGFDVHTSTNGTDAVLRMERGQYAAVIADDSLDDLTALELGLTARDILTCDPLVLVVAPASRQSIERVSNMIRIRCFDDHEELFDHLPILVAAIR